MEMVTHYSKWKSVQLYMVTTIYDGIKTTVVGEGLQSGCEEDKKQDHIAIAFKKRRKLYINFVGHSSRETTGMVTTTTS